MGKWFIHILRKAMERRRLACDSANSKKLLFIIHLWFAQIRPANIATFRNNEKLFGRLRANTINCLIYVIQEGVEMSDLLVFPITQDQQFNLFLQIFS